MIPRRSGWVCLATKPLLSVSLVALMSAVGLAAGVMEVEVFKSGTEGYHTYRIPAIVQATNGTLLAFAEGRRKSAADTGEIDVVLKRSTDNGGTWGALQVVGDGGSNTFGNPVPIVESRTGKIVLLTTHNSGKVSETQIRKGEAQDRRVFVQESVDNGLSWSVAREITAETKRPSWRGYATGPVHGIQLTRGPHAGRLVAPCDHTTTNSSQWSACGSHLLLSDNGGVSWRIGADDSPNTGVINPNECAAVELVDGGIFTVTRNQEGIGAGNRAVAYSSNAGETFDHPFSLDLTLVSPVVQASVLRFTANNQGEPTNRILFSSPADPSKRVRMTVRSSFDETRTWTAGKVIYAGPAAYSDMVKLPNNRVGLLYESGVKSPYERITFARFGVDYLDTPDRP
jgi:hypothetical protein